MNMFFFSFPPLISLYENVIIEKRKIVVEMKWKHKAKLLPPRAS